MGCNCGQKKAARLAAKQEAAEKAAAAEAEANKS